MCTYLVCVAGLLTALVLAEPGCAEEIEPSAPVQSLCPFVRSAANQTQLEAGINDRIHEEKMFPERESNIQSAVPFQRLLSAGSPATTGKRKLIASILLDKVSFKDLAPQQRALISRLPARCGITTNMPLLPASVFRQLDPSQRAVFVANTQALLHTHIIDSRDGKDLGALFQLIDELLDIRGANSALHSDHQFHLVVRLVPDARQKLERAAQFEGGENHFYHKKYPLSFRQLRKFGHRGQEAGLHICLTRDGQFAEIHIDYRFFLLHLGSANSDVRADGNLEKHIARWPQLEFGENQSEAAVL
jgi:hypothetical protein